MRGLAGLILVALGLGANNFAAAVGVAAGPRPAPAQRVLVWFVGFEVLMLAAGLLAGNHFAAALGRVARYGGGGLLTLIGALSLRPSSSRHSGRMAVTAVAASIDSLAVGFALGLHGPGVALALVVIAIAATAMTAAGLAVGRRLGEAAPVWGRRVGAVILIAVGVVTAAGVG